MNLKDGWNASNHSLNYLLRAITFQHPILSFQINELNLHSLAHCQENSTAPSEVPPRSADLCAPLSSQSFAKPKFMRPQTHRNGKHAETMLNDIRELLDNTQDPTHRMALYSGTWEFIKHKSYNQTYIADEQLQAMELCIHHCIKIQVEGVDGDVYLRCVAAQKGRAGAERIDGTTGCG